VNKLLSFFCKIFLKPIVHRLLIKEVRGLENIPKAPFILVSNHTSYLDIIINGYLCVPDKFHFIGQIDSWKGIAKLFIRAFYFICGVIPLDRKNDLSREEVLKRAIGVLKKGNILILYPEGRRSVNGQVQEGRFGAARIFLKTKVPIIAAGIKGTFELMPPKGKLKIKRVVRVNIGKPLFFEEELALAKNLIEEQSSSPTSAKTSADEDSEEYQEILEKITDKTIEELKKLTA